MENIPDLLGYLVLNEDTTIMSVSFIIMLVI